ncbi:MAG: hypothetical protein HYX75_20110 [Acidobacteria bacterium]|nr:hypothetical protein [Acidobacteriota bacterium]
MKTLRYYERRELLQKPRAVAPRLRRTGPSAGLLVRCAAARSRLRTRR